MIASVQDTFTNSDVASTKALMEDHHGTSSLDRKSTNDEGEIEDEEEREEAKWKKVCKNKSRLYTHIETGSWMTQSARY